MISKCFQIVYITFTNKTIHDHSFYNRLNYYKIYDNVFIKIIISSLIVLFYYDIK